MAHMYGTKWTGNGCDNQRANHRGILYESHTMGRGVGIVVQ